MEPNAVPLEVREWLASTFTRAASNQKRSAMEKPRFRSVANAIRAGLLVDRLYRRISKAELIPCPPDVARLLKVGIKLNLSPVLQVLPVY